MARPTARRWHRVLAIVAGLTLTACGASPTVEIGDPGEAGGAATSLPAAGTPDGLEAAYSCFGPPFPASAWAGGEPADGIDHPGREVLLAEMRTDDLDGWFVLEAGEERLTVARELPEDHPRDDRLRTHELVSVMYAENVEPGPWVLGQWSACAPQLAMDGLGPADVWLDGEADPPASEVALLVKEIGCASGRSAEDRLRVVSIEEDASAVTFVIGVEPVSGAADCPDNPATPMTLELSQPLGGRRLVDASVYPPQEVPPPPPDLHR